MLRDAPKGAFEEPEPGLGENQQAVAQPEDNLLLDLVLDNPWAMDNPWADLPDPDEEAVIVIAPIEEEEEDKEEEEEEEVGEDVDR